MIAALIWMRTAFSVVPQNFLILRCCFKLNLPAVLIQVSNFESRQMEGIRIAMEKGIKFGRPRKQLPVNTHEILDQYVGHEITWKDASCKMGVSRGTFYRLLRRHKEHFQPTSMN